MTPKFIPLLERCIESGIQLGWNRAHKHTETPDDALIFQKMSDAIFEELFEWFDFEEQNDDIEK